MAAELIQNIRFSIPYDKSNSNKDAVLAWKEETKGVVYIPIGAPGKDGRVIFYDKDEGPIEFPNLEDYLDGLHARGLNFSWYQIIVVDKLYLIPNHPPTIAKFVRVQFPTLYEKFGNPKKVRFNYKTWKFTRFTAPTNVVDNTNNVVNDNMTFVQGKRLVGKKGIVSKTFRKKTGCTLSVSFNKEDNTSSVKIQGPSEKIETARMILMGMIQIASTGNIDISLIPSVDGEAAVGGSGSGGGDEDAVGGSGSGGGDEDDIGGSGSGGGDEHQEE